MQLLFIGSSPFRRAICIMLAAFGAGACTQVTVKSDGNTDVMNHFGIVHINVDTQSKPAYVNAKGIGVVFSEGHFNLGWMDNTGVTFPNEDDCRAVFVVQNSDDAEVILNFFRETKTDISTICITGEGI
ncbi:MAG: hypothetical protein NUV50_02310 [Rhodospirillales bacterium]|nr:hypothetical protein [Rhodospirillales bacterium]